MAFRSAPFQLPRTRSTVAATLQRMATGGKPALPTFVAPQNPTTVTPYKGDMAHYGEGPEWDFFQTPAPPPPPAKPPTGGDSGGSGGDPSHPFGGDGSGSKNPWNQGGGGTSDPSHPFGGDGSGSRNPWNQPPSGGSSGTGTDLPTTTPRQDAILTSFGITPGAHPITHQTPGFQDQGSLTPILKPAQNQTPQNLARMASLGVVPKAPAPDPIQSTGPTARQQGILTLLGVSPQVTASAPAAQQQPAPAPHVMPPQIQQSANPLTAYLQNVNAQTKPRPAGGSPRNMADGGSVDPGAPDSAAQAIASLRQAPLGQRGELNQGGPGANLTGQDQANRDQAVNPSLKSALSIGSMVAGLAMSPVAGAIATAAKLGIGALTGQPMTDPFDVPGPRLTADQLQAAADAYNNTPGPLTNRMAAYNNSIEGSRTADRPPTGAYGNTALAGGVSRGSSFAGGSAHDPALGGGDRAGEGYGGQGGDVGSGRGDMDAGGGPDKGGLYARGGGVRRLAQGGLPRFPSIRRFADGGSASQFLDASSQSMAQPMPATPDTGNSSGFSAQLLPLLAGAYSAQTNGPAAGAASLGAATAMLGGSMQDAMDSATLLYRAGASQQPHAQRREFDPKENQTTALLASLAQQAGISNQLRASASDPSVAMAASNSPHPYAKPQVRTFSSGGNSQPVKGPGDGQSDEIPAMLSNNEHVIDAGTVAMLGNGDSDAGHKRLDEMRQLIRKNAGMRNPKKIVGKQPDVSKMLAQVSGRR